MNKEFRGGCECLESRESRGVDGIKVQEYVFLGEDIKGSLKEMESS